MSHPNPTHDPSEDPMMGAVIKLMNEEAERIKEMNAELMRQDPSIRPEVLGNNGEEVSEPEDAPEPDPDNYEHRAEQWQRDHAEDTAPRES